MECMLCDGLTHWLTAWPGFLRSRLSPGNCWDKLQQERENRLSDLSRFSAVHNVVLLLWIRFRLPDKKKKKKTVDLTFFHPILQNQATSFISINTPSCLLWLENLNICHYQEVWGLRLEVVSGEWLPLQSFVVYYTSLLICGGSTIMGK